MTTVLSGTWYVSLWPLVIDHRGDRLRTFRSRKKDKKMAQSPECQCQVEATVSLPATAASANLTVSSFNTARMVQHYLKLPTPTIDILHVSIRSLGGAHVRVSSQTTSA